MCGWLDCATSYYVVQRRPATGWPPRRAPRAAKNRNHPGCRPPTDPPAGVAKTASSSCEGTDNRKEIIRLQAGCWWRRYDEGLHDPVAETVNIPAFEDACSLTSSGTGATPAVTDHSPRLRKAANAGLISISSPSRCQPRSSRRRTPRRSSSLPGIFRLSAVPFTTQSRPRGSFATTKPSPTSPKAYRRSPTTRARLFSVVSEVEECDAFARVASDDGADAPFPLAPQPTPNSPTMTAPATAKPTFLPILSPPRSGLPIAARQDLFPAEATGTLPAPPLLFGMRCKSSI